MQIMQIILQYKNSLGIKNIQKNSKLSREPNLALKLISTIFLRVHLISQWKCLELLPKGSCCQAESCSISACLSHVNM